MYKGLGKWVVLFSVVLFFLVSYTFGGGYWNTLSHRNGGRYDSGEWDQLFLGEDEYDYDDDAEDANGNAVAPSYNAMKDGQLQQLDPHVH